MTYESQLGILGTKAVTPTKKQGVLIVAWMYILNLKCMGNHKVVEFMSKGQIVNFLTSIGDTSLTKCLSYVMILFGPLGLSKIPIL